MRLRIPDSILIFAFCGFFFFWRIAAFGLIGADEPRYAQVAREMLVRHDWITPTLGGVPWLEKPPLYYWLMTPFLTMAECWSLPAMVFLLRVVSLLLCTLALPLVPVHVAYWRARYLDAAGAIVAHGPVQVAVDGVSQ